MNDIQIASLSPRDIREIQARAQEMRAQAMSDMLRRLGRAIAAPFQKKAATSHA